MVIIKNKYFILILLLLLFVLFVTGCDKMLEDSKKYIVTVTVKNVDIDTGEQIRTATTKTEDGKQGSTSNGVTTFSLEGNKEYTFISNAPYYNESKKKAFVGKENILITIEMSKVKSKITGHIVDSQGNNVKEAIVELTDLGKKTESDENGKFVFENIPSSGDKTYTINIEKTGYGKRIVSNVKVVGNDTVDLGKIVLSSNPGIISGKVTDINGAELNNINVNVVELGRSARTDYSGSFTISVPPGTYTIRFTHSNFDDVEEVVTVESDENKFINIKMEPKPGSISGIVLDNYGQPVYGVQVSILGINKSVKTLSNGHFVFDEIPPGNYTLEFSHPSFRVSNQKVTVKSNQETVMGNIMLQEKTGMLTGRVLEEETGNSIPNANVKVRETGEYVSTNSEGYFTFSNIRVGEYTLDITAISYSSAVINNVVIKENSVTTVNDVWLVKDPATLVGTVKDSVSGEPLSGVLLVINELDLRVETDNNGSFRLEGIKAGSYSITVIYDNYFQRNITGVYLGPNETLNLGTINLEPRPGKITGITTPGAEVRIAETGKRVVVNDTGSFILQDIVPGKYTLNITLANYYAKSYDITISPGELLELGDVSLEPMPGRIVGSSNAESITILELDRKINNTADTFSFDNVYPGEYRLLFEKDNYYSREIIVVVNPNQTVDVRTVTLEPMPGIIRGYTDSGVKVRIAETKQEIIIDGGYFEFTDLKPGNYTLSFTKAHYYSKEITKSVGPNETVDLGTIHLDPIPATIFGRTNATEVTIVETSKKATVSNNTFTLNSILPGTYTLRYTRDNYYTTEITVTVGPEDNYDAGTVNLEPYPGKITGYLYSNYNVILIQEGKSLNKSGYFEFTDLKPGNYTVKVERDGYYYSLINLVLNPGENKNLGTIRLIELPDLEQKTETVQVNFNMNSKYFNVKFEQTIYWYIYAWGESVFNIGGWDHQIGEGRIVDPEGTTVVTVRHKGDGSTSDSGSFRATKLGNWRVYMSVGGDGGDEGASGWVRYQEDRGKPRINFSRTWGYGEPSYTVYINATDEHSGISRVEYNISKNENQHTLPFTITNGSFVTINSPGTWFLHVKAIDNNGNERYQVEGPFIIE